MLSIALSANGKASRQPSGERYARTGRSTHFPDHPHVAGPNANKCKEIRCVCSALPCATCALQSREKKLHAQRRDRNGGARRSRWSRSRLFRIPRVELWRRSGWRMIAPPSVPQWAHSHLPMTSYFPQRIKPNANSEDGRPARQIAQYGDSDVQGGAALRGVLKLNRQICSASGNWRVAQESWRVPVCVIRKPCAISSPCEAETLASFVTRRDITRSSSGWRSLSA